MGKAELFLSGLPAMQAGIGVYVLVIQYAERTAYAGVIPTEGRNPQPCAERGGKLML